MKVHHNKNGLGIITLAAIVCVGLNMMIRNESLIGGIGYTIGIIAPYILFLLLYLVYGLIRYRQIRFYTQWQVAIFILILQFLSLYPVISEQLFDSSKQTEEESPVEQPRLGKIPFKEFLKSQGANMDLNIANEFETFQPGNKYSNHYFNVTTDFPDNWEADRGMSAYSMFRAIQFDSALSISLSAVPIETDTEGSSEFLNPLDKMNLMAQGDYKTFLLDQLKRNTPAEIYDFELTEAKVRSNTFLVHNYKYNETVDGVEIPFHSIGYQTTLWNVVYTISYSCPLAFYDPEIMNTTLNRTSFIKYQK